MRILREKCRRWVGAGRWGPPPIKKNSIFLGKNSHFFRVFFRFQLCRMPDKRHSAKTPLPTGYLSSVLCRVQHSAKPLPSTNWALSSAAFGKAFAECKFGLILVVSGQLGSTCECQSLLRSFLDGVSTSRSSLWMQLTIGGAWRTTLQLQSAYGGANVRRFSSPMVLDRGKGRQKTSK